MPVASPVRRVLRKIYRSFVPEPIPACDTDTINVFRRVLKPDSHCIDIGCNRGSILQEMLKQAPGGKHFAFEPIPRLYELLVKRFPNVTVHRMAASDQTGSFTFHHFENMDGYSGLVKRTIDVDPGKVTEIEVKCERLDVILPADLPIRLIKIDVEGAELKVLTGATGTLEKYRPVLIFECGAGGLDIYGHQPEQVFDLLARFGYELRYLTGWDLAAKPFTRDEFVHSFHHSKEYMYVGTVPGTV